MLEILFPLMGGIGLFLVGMMLLTDGLVAMAGGTLKRALVRFTGTPTKAFVSGTLVTALVQSSSATTVTLIGFVSAGLITFSQTIGVLIGASLGNTATGWIVSGLGLRLNLGFFTLPLVGIGALLKLLGRGNWADLGLCLVGFGMMFVGLSTLQDGMRGLATVFNLADLPASGYGARFAAMLVGLALTAVLQSSTAAIATTLTALHTHTISFDQAAALVVGAAIGTTLTGVLVAVGGSVYAKRTALAYVLFNLAAGLIAILLLPVFIQLIAALGTHAGLRPGAMSLAAFHTLFIALGVALFLPLTHRYARLVERLLPDLDHDMSDRLDDSLLSIPAVALEAAQRALEQITGRLLDAYAELLSGTLPPDHAARLAKTGIALDRTFDFVSRIQLDVDDEAGCEQRIAQLHAIDHLLRLRSRLYNLEQAHIDFADPAYDWALEISRGMLGMARQGISEQDLAGCMQQLEHDAEALAGLSRKSRHQWLQQTATRNHQAADALRTTDAFRWLERTGNHIWRACHYLALGRAPGNHAPGQDAAAPMETD